MAAAISRALHMTIAAVEAIPIRLTFTARLIHHRRQQACAMTRARRACDGGTALRLVTSSAASSRPTLALAINADAIARAVFRAHGLAAITLPPALVTLALSILLAHSLSRAVIDALDLVAVIRHEWIEAAALPVDTCTMA